MKTTMPADRTLDDMTKIRPFRADTPKIKELKKKTGFDEIELTRRAVHVGLPILAEALGIELDETKEPNTAVTA